MRSRRLVDTNLIVRYLTGDHPGHAKIAGRLIEASDRGELTLVVLPAVLAECVFVLESFYRRSPEQVGRTLSQLVSSPGFEMADAAVHQNALERYRKGKVHFVDCVVAAYAAAEKIAVATFDADFRKFSGVNVSLD
jgi:predicted nucleic acid-binding protein